MNSNTVNPHLGRQIKSPRDKTAKRSGNNLNFPIVMAMLTALVSGIWERVSPLMINTLLGTVRLIVKAGVGLIAIFMLPITYIPGVKSVSWSTVVKTAQVAGISIVGLSLVGMFALVVDSIERHSAEMAMLATRVETQSLVVTGQEDTSNLAVVFDCCDEDGHHNGVLPQWSLTPAIVNLSVADSEESDEEDTIEETVESPTENGEIDIDNPPPSAEDETIAVIPAQIANPENRPLPVLNETVNIGWTVRGQNRDNLQSFLNWWTVNSDLSPEAISGLAGNWGAELSFDIYRDDGKNEFGMWQIQQRYNGRTPFIWRIYSENYSELTSMESQSQYILDILNGRWDAEIAGTRLETFKNEFLASTDIDGYARAFARHFCRSCHTNWDKRVRIGTQVYNQTDWFQNI